MLRDQDVERCTTGDIDRVGATTRRAAPLKFQPKRE